MREEHFIQLPSQGNIYSVCKLANHLIVGTGDHGKVFAQISKKEVREIPLHLPNECDIISVDAYVDTFPVLAAAFVQKVSGGNVPGAIPVGKGKYVTAHLHIYSTWISSSDQNSPTSTTSTGSNKSLSRLSFQPPKEEFHASHFEFIGQNHISFKLNYFPFHLYHVPVVKSNGNFGNILLLSGSDRKIHAFESDDESLTFVEIPVKTYFPELAQRFPDVVTRIRIEPVNEITRRITLCGLQNGTVIIWIVTCKPQSNMQGSTMTGSTGSNTNSSKSRTSPDLELEPDPIADQEDVSETHDLEASEKVLEDIKALELGADGDTASLAESIDTALSTSSDEHFEKIVHSHFSGLITSIQSYVDGFELNVIVSSALSPTYVYTNSYEDRFEAGTPLKFSSRWDTVQACCVADIDMDGRAEIILGTFGQALLVYKYMDEILPQWVIVSKKQFSRGILGIEFINHHLHVVTALGIHVLEYNTSAYFTNKPTLSSESFEVEL